MLWLITPFFAIETWNRIRSSSCCPRSSLETNEKFSSHETTIEDNRGGKKVAQIPMVGAPDNAFNQPNWSFSFPLASRNMMLVVKKHFRESNQSRFPFRRWMRSNGDDDDGKKRQKIFNFDKMQSVCHRKKNLEKASLNWSESVH